MNITEIVVKYLVLSSRTDMGLGRDRNNKLLEGVVHAQNFLGLIFLVVFLSLVEISSVMCPFISQAMQRHLRITPQLTK